MQEKPLQVLANSTGAPKNRSHGRRSGGPLRVGPPASARDAEETAMRYADRLVDEQVTVKPGRQGKLDQAGLAVFFERDVDDVVEVPLVGDAHANDFAQVGQMLEQHADRPEVGERAPRGGE